MGRQKQTFWYKNGLSLAMMSFMIIFWAAQFITGLKVRNEERKENGYPEISAKEYLSSGHFIESTFENWESEFLQMFFYILLTVSLRQKGSSESKSLTEKDPVDREPKAHAKAPWPVKKGGIWLKIYSHSLSIAFLLLFIFSFVLHFIGSLKHYNEEQIEKHLPTSDALSYIGDWGFWFESFQNWQSEFLAVASIVLLSIWLRQKGSPESKPVDMPHDENK